MKIAGAAALVPSSALAQSEREVLFLPTPLLNFYHVPCVPTLRGRVVLRADDIARLVREKNGIPDVWGTLVRRDGVPTLGPLSVDESIEWDFNENIHHDSFLQVWKLPRRGGGCFSFDEWQGNFAGFIDEHVREHLEGAQSLGLPHHMRLVVLAGCLRYHDPTMSRAYTYGLATAFVDGDIEWDGPMFQHSEELVEHVAKLLSPAPRRHLALQDPQTLLEALRDLHVKDKIDLKTCEELLGDEYEKFLTLLR
jgi:hypothetical protein